MEGNGFCARRVLPILKRYRRVAFGGLVVVGAALVGWWLLPSIIFEYRFRAVLPAGASRKTKVSSMSVPPPTGVPKTYRQQIDEYFGYYGPMRMSATWWKHYPKALDEVLDEYGARVQDGKLVDANGRNICIMKKLRSGWRSDAKRREWEDRRGKLLEEQCTVLVLDIEEDE